MPSCSRKQSVALLSPMALSSCSTSFIESSFLSSTPFSFPSLLLRPPAFLRTKASCCGTRRMSLATKRLRPSLSVCGTRQKLRLSKQARFLPTTAHTALALDSATGSGQVRVRCHSLRQSTSHIVMFSASRKHRLCLGFSSPHKAGFAGSPFFSAPGSAPIAPPCVKG